MTSIPQRDPVAGHLITPQNAVLPPIDYQPREASKVRSRDQRLLVENIVSTVKTANAYAVPIVIDAIGGTSSEAHRAAVERVVQAGGRPITWVSLIGKLQRDWARQKAVDDFVEILFTDRLSAD